MAQYQVSGGQQPQYVQYQHPPQQQQQVVYGYPQQQPGMYVQQQPGGQATQYMQQPQPGQQVVYYAQPQAGQPQMVMGGAQMQMQQRPMQPPQPAFVQQQQQQPKALTVPAGTAPQHSLAWGPYVVPWLPVGPLVASVYFTDHFCEKCLMRDDAKKFPLQFVEESDGQGGQKITFEMLRNATFIFCAVAFVLLISALSLKMWSVRPETCMTSPAAEVGLFGMCARVQATDRSTYEATDLALCYSFDGECYLLGADADGNSTKSDKPIAHCAAMKGARAFEIMSVAALAGGIGVLVYVSYYSVTRRLRWGVRVLFAIALATAFFAMVCWSAFHSQTASDCPSCPPDKPAGTRVDGEACCVPFKYGGAYIMQHLAWLLLIGVAVHVHKIMPWADSVFPDGDAVTTLGK